MQNAKMYASQKSQCVITSTGTCIAAAAMAAAWMQGQAQQAAAAAAAHACKILRPLTGITQINKEKLPITRAEILYEMLYAVAAAELMPNGNVFTTDSEPKKVFKNPYRRTLRCRKLLATCCRLSLLALAALVCLVLCARARCENWTFVELSKIKSYLQLIHKSGGDFPVLSTSLPPLPLLQSSAFLNNVQ